jgi:hypothetical protein
LFIRVDRIGKASDYVNLPALIVLLAVQPSVLNGLMSNDVFRGRGLTARFLYSMPVSKEGTRSFETEKIDNHISESYENLIRRLPEM